MNEKAIIPYEAADLRIARDPEAILSEAKKAAECLVKVVELKKNKVVFNNEQYLEFEDWQTVAKFYGITAQVTQVTFVDYGGVKGFEAGADAIGPDGRILSHAESLCLNDEDNWSTRAKYEYVHDLDADGNKIWISAKGDKKGYYKGQKKKVGEVPVPLFQLKSMAQTRACAKVLRNILAWVVVLAGYKPTVAEEMMGNEQQEETATPLQKPKPKTEAMDMADFKKMKSKYAGKCKSCEKGIAVDEEILFNTKIKGAVYHPACLVPKAEAEPSAQAELDKPAPKAILNNLEMLAKEAKVKLLDRIGRDGKQSLEEISLGYATELLKEFAEIIDGAKE